MFIYNSIDAFLSFLILLYNSIVIILILVIFWGCLCKFPFLVCVCTCFFSRCLLTAPSTKKFLFFFLFYNSIISGIFLLMLEFIVATTSTPFLFVYFSIFHHSSSPFVFIYRSINAFLLFFVFLQFHCKQSFPLDACESMTPLVHF
jgi:hypothetical protein